MRTKALLLSAALVAAGVATSMAQSNVYSLNIVGYVNVQVQPGYNLICNQLDVDGVDNVNVALTNGTPDQAQLFTWNAAGGVFNNSITFFAGNGWFDQDLNPATNDVFPGSAFFLYNPAGATTVTLTGSVVTSTNSSTVTPGYGFYAVVPPVASDLDTNGFPAEDQMQYFTFANGTYSASYTYFNGNGWFDQDLNQVFPTPAVGQGFVIYNPDAAATWTQSFSVQ